MSPDMHVHSGPDTQAVIYARMDQFDLMTRILGCESDTARGQLIGMSARQVTRARTHHVGSAFVANTLVALRQHERTIAARNLQPTFDALFTVQVIARTKIEVAAAA